MIKSLGLGLALGVLALVVLALGGVAQACSCVNFERAQMVEAVEVVFDGTVDSVRVKGMQSLARVRVLSVEKGKVGKIVSVRSHVIGAMCGVRFQVGQKASFGGSLKNGVLEANGCVQGILNRP